MNVVTEAPTRVVFRVWPTGDVIALFPTLTDGPYCTSYERVGQHSGADYGGVIARTRPARREEYADLAAELRRIGYVLEIRARR